MLKHINIIIFSFICFSTSFLYAIDKNEFQQFAREYANRQPNHSTWSEFIFAIEKEYDEMALFFAGKNQPFIYESEIIERKADINGSKTREVFYKNSIINLIKQNKLVLLEQILNLLPNESNTYEYSKVLGKEEEKLQAIHIAIENDINALDIVKILVEHGADVNEYSYKIICNPSWKNNTYPNQLYYQYTRMAITPLQVATQKEKFDVIEYLIINGANVSNAYGFNSYGLLDLTIIRNRLDITELLIKMGSNGKTHQYGLNNSLYTAIKCNNINAIVLLLNNGAQPKTEHVSQALQLDFYEIADLLTDQILRSSS